MDWTLDNRAPSSARFRLSRFHIRHGSTSWNPSRERRDPDDQDEYAEIDLAALSDDELVEQMHNDLYDGMKDEIVEGTNILLGRGFSATRVLDDALVAGMKIVGIDFRDGILFVPEVLLAANAMKAGMAILRPLLAETGAEPVGKVVIGTVKGDIHDIGKNLVGMMLEGAGFEVFDLGINTDADKFIAALEEHQPGHPRHVGAADDDDAVHEGRHPDAQGPRHPRRLHRPRRRRAAQRGVRAWRSAPTPTAAMPAWPPRRPGASSTSAVPASPEPGAATADRATPPRVLVIGCGALARELRGADPRACPNVDVTCLPATPAQPAGRHPGGRPRPDPDARRGRLRRGSSSPTPTAGPAACSTRSSRDEGVERLAGRPLLRVLRRPRGLRARCTDEEPGDVLPDRLPGPQLRPPGHPAASGSTATRSCCRPTSATTAGSSTSPRPTTRRSTGRPGAPPDRLGLAFERRRTGLRRARDRPSPSRPIAGAVVAGIAEVR